VTFTFLGYAFRSRKVKGKNERTLAVLTFGRRANDGRALACWRHM